MTYQNAFTLAQQQRQRKRPQHKQRPSPPLLTQPHQSPSPSPHKKGQPALPSLSLATGSATQQLGATLEAQAARFLEQQGLQLIYQNLRCPFGELDLVMCEGQVLVFVEVRGLRQPSIAPLSTSIDWRKQQRIKASARYFLPKLMQLMELKEIPNCRYDVVLFEGDTAPMQWWRGAFS